MKVLGITGGIGSGKSVVANLLRHSGVAVYDADARARAIMVEDEKLKAEIIQLFGAEAYFSDGSLNRAHLSKQVFTDSVRLNQLNAIVHPASGRDFLEWTSRHRENGHPWVAKEAAILFESGAYLACDKVVCVYAPLSLRVQRVVARDNADAQAVLARVARQWPEQKKQAASNHLVINDGHHHLIPQVMEVFRWMNNFSAPREGSGVAHPRESS